MMTARSIAGDKKVVIVALGDSTTAGTPFFLSPLESPPDGHGDPEGQYAYWMMRRRPGWKVMNCGIDGQRSDEIRARFDEAMKANPRYIIILAGVNDVYQGYPIHEIAQNLQWMYQQSKGRGVIPVAATVLPFNEATSEQSAKIRELNELIRKIADHERIPLADLHAAVSDPQNPDRLNGSPDGLHPDIGGYRAMGVALTKVLDEMEAARPH